MVDVSEDMAKRFVGVLRPATGDEGPEIATCQDHPLVRSDCECLICRGPKELGLVACWPCYRARAQWDAFEDQLDAAERELASAQTR